MPSPFPGMDPYLENPNIWPDFHERLANQISTSLNNQLPIPYYARLEMRPEVGIVEDEGYPRRIVPDVAVVRSSRAPIESAGIAVLDAPRTMISPSVEVTIKSEHVRHHFVEIRDPSQGHKLITLIEIASPSNKRAGEDRSAYLRKQSEVWNSDANLIELDLLRNGNRLIGGEILSGTIAHLDPAPDYLVMVNRSWMRSDDVAMQVFSIHLQEPLPCIPIPLRQGQPEIPLDLQFVFNRAYDSGPYLRGAVDYSEPPKPPVREEQSAWVEQHVKKLFPT